jgi:hypothetical protein
VTPKKPQPVNSRTGRQHAQAQALTALQHQAAATPTQAHDLRQQVQQHLTKQQHALTTAQLIDLIIARYPDCPRFASLMVDRLLTGDEALAAALQEGLR